MAAPRIGDPRAVPVRGTDAHLPPVPRERLAPDELRRRLAAAATHVPEFAGDGVVGAGGAGRAPAAAAVLVPLVQRAAGPTVLLTRRAEHLRDHAGQVSFPGGRCERGDDGPPATALREAQEEVGLQASSVEVIGRLPDYTTVTGFVVTPVVALVHPPFALVLDAFEVAEAFEVPLAFLMDPANHRRHRFEHDGVMREFLSMPWTAPPMPGAGLPADDAPREHFIWGATAAMLRNLYGLLAR